MSGFGIHEQYVAGLEMYEAGKRWREDAFLHQLAHNGSLLLLANHDALWCDSLARLLGQPRGTRWERMCALLRAVPAHDARRRLYIASFMWYAAAERLRLRLLRSSIETGSTAALRGEGGFSLLEARLKHSAQQLQELRWCLTDSDKGTISVIETL